MAILMFLPGAKVETLPPADTRSVSFEHTEHAVAVGDGDAIGLISYRLVGIARRGSNGCLTA